MTYLPESFPVLKEALIRVKNHGFVTSTRPNNKDGGIGNTLESLLDVKENNLQAPDFLDFEIKSQRDYTSSPVSLFSSATQSRGNRRLFELFKKVDTEENIARLYWSIYMHKVSFLYNRYNVILKFDSNTNPTFLSVSVTDTIDKFTHDNEGWNLNKLERKISEKMKNLVLCTTETNNSVGGTIQFKYTKFDCYFGFDFNRFIDAITEGKVQVDFRIGADITGKNAGKYHDHGTAFRISGKDLLALYSHHESF